MRTLFRVIIIACLVAICTGCKLAVVVVQGGEVQSTASGTCLPAAPGMYGAVCIHEVSDTSYSETFTAVPDPGWAFVKWNSGGDFFCQDSTSPTCLVSNIGTAGNAGIEAIVASDKTFYIMPVFTEVGLPITDTVMFGGKEWAQVDLFTDLSWREIDTVCHGGACVNGGVLSGNNMTGWMWASEADVLELFNAYIPLEPPLGPGPDTVFSLGSWTLDLFDDGWRPTRDESTSIGQAIELLGHISRPYYRASWNYASVTQPSSLTTSSASITAINQDTDLAGGFFYRTP